MTMTLYGCQLASNYKIFPEGKTLWVEPKLDGYRLMAMVSTDSVRFITRGNKSSPYTENLAFIGRQLLDLGFRNCMVDGEIMAADWNQTAICRKKTLSEEDQKVLATVKFHVFDYVDLSQVERQQIGRIYPFVFSAPAWYRRETLLDHMDAKLAPNVVETTILHVTSHEEVVAECDRLLELGYEGLMVKDGYAPYVFAKSKAWLKVKPTETYDAVVTAVVEGTGKYVGMMGALSCRMVDGTEFNVGTGFSDDLRSDLWGRRADLLGLWVEVKMQAGDVATARHPVFVRWRPDRD